MRDHHLQESFRRVHGLIIPWRVAAGLQRAREAGYRGRTTVEGRDVVTGLPREVAGSLEDLLPPTDGPATADRT